MGPSAATSGGRGQDGGRHLEIYLLGFPAPFSLAPLPGCPLCCAPPCAVSGRERCSALHLQAAYKAPGGEGPQAVSSEAVVCLKGKVRPSEAGRPCLRPGHGPPTPRLSPPGHPCTWEGGSARPHDTGRMYKSVLHSLSIACPKFKLESWWKN